MVEPHPSSSPVLDRLLAQDADPHRAVLLTGATIVTGRAADIPARGDLLVVGSRIASVGPGAASDPAARGAVAVELAGSIVMPGFVDSHLHAWEGQLRGLAPDADFDAYVDLAHRELAPHYRPEDSYIGNLTTALACLDAGITTIVDNSHNTRSPEHGVAAVDGLAHSGIRAVHAAGAPLSGRWDLPMAAHLDRLADHVAGTGELITLRLMEGAPTVENWRLAAERGLWVSTEVLGDDWLPELTRSPGRELARAGHTFNHCAGLSAQAWRFVVDAGITVNVCPRSDSQFGIGPAHPAVDQPRALGLLPGLSSDNELSYGIDMFTEMRVLLHLQRAGHHRDRGSAEPAASRVTAAEAVEMATLGGARNAALSDRTGTLDVGKQADLLIIDPIGPGVVAPADPAAAVALFAHPGSVTGVFVDGHVRKWGRDLVGVDVRSVRAAAEASREHLVTARRAAIR